MMGFGVVQLAAFVPWLLRTSVEASLLIAVVLLVRGLSGERISARWRSALWLLVVVRVC